MEYFFENIKNNIDFFLRNKLVFSRKNYNEKSEDKSFIKSNLAEKYDLNILKDTTVQNYKENLYFLDIFDKYLTKNKKDKISILDIGSKNWYYAKSEYIFFNSFCNNFELNGIELDSNRLCLNLYSRKEIAKFHTKNFKNTNYISGDFLKHNKKYDYIIWILPFILKYPHIKWGLPLKYFKPDNMLKHAYELLNNNGELLIINQGENEYNFQIELYKKYNLKFENLGKTDDKFKLFKNNRYCSKIIKKLNPYHKDLL